MEITFTKDELSGLMTELDNWYNERSLFVIIEGMKRVDQYSMKKQNSRETFHKLAKEFQAEHPKPDWRNLL